VQLLDDTIDADFIDINVGCPIDLVSLRSFAKRLCKNLRVARGMQRM
jgi:tRNA-dihydrouridine synthase